MIKEKRLINEFLELIKISSQSRQEKEICELVERKLKSLGATLFLDKQGGSTSGTRLITGEKIGSSGYNIIGKIKGDSTARGATSLPTVILNAHLDTVVPGENIKPITEDNIIKSDGSTILGADDKSGVAIILEVLKVLQENNLRHPPIEIVFTICEETGLLGAKTLDFSILKGKYGYSLDTESIESIVTSAPSHNKFFIKIYGAESHAGAEPEKGISAIEVASEAISSLSASGKLGKIDEITTANIGTINGGVATNIIAGYTEIEGEARSHSEERLKKVTKEIIECFKKVATQREKIVDGEKKISRIEESISREYSSFSIPDNSEVVLRAMESARSIGLTPKTVRSGGGSDANIFNAHGIQTAVIGTGMQKVHTKQEYIKIGDLLTGAKLLLRILTL